MNGDLKLTFMQKTLTEYFQQVETRIKLMARKMKVGVTDEGIKSLSHKVVSQNASASGSLSFLEYLRMVDMGVGKGHPLGGLRSMKVSLKAQHKTGFIQKKDNVRRAKKLYSKSAWGELTWLQNKLLYGFTEETIDMLKKELTT